ncbi:hypothetical protein [Salinarimonas chemoclinalis]|uniref:hypothetical protein n=1 Tax=Salinarimonas chemoclinalis TaxID=3241599 RepID=UPI00355702EB
MGWKIVRASLDAAPAKMIELQEAFFLVYVAAGQPRGAVVLEETSLPERETRIFFSPPAANIFQDRLALERAEDTEEPSGPNVSVLFRNETG